MKIECERCTDVVDVETSTVVAPFVCKWCLEDNEKECDSTEVDKDLPTYSVDYPTIKDMLIANGWIYPDDIIKPLDIPLDIPCCDGNVPAESTELDDVETTNAFIDDLQEQLKRAEEAAENNYKSAENLKDELEARDRWIDELEDVVSEERLTIKALYLQADGFKNEVARLEGELRTTKRTVECLNSELTWVRAELKTSETAWLSAMSTIARLETNIKFYQFNQEEHQTQIDAANRRVARAEQTWWERLFKNGGDR